MKPENLQKIRDFFETIYLVKSDDIEDLMSKFIKVSDKAFDKIFDILKDAKNYQDGFLKKTIEKDPSFVNNLNAFLDKNYREIGKQVTKDERKSADKILENL